MKIFDTIKKHIILFFSEKNLSLIRNDKEIKNLDSDGPINIELHSIHSVNVPTQISKSELEDMMRKFFSTNNVHRPEKKKVLLDIYGDCLQLHKALIPLVELNIAYSIDLVGGAVRDFLLNNHNKIKDLDVLVRLTNAYNIRNHTTYYLGDLTNHRELVIENILKKNWCTREELEDVDFLDNDLLYKKHNKLLQLCLNRNHQLTSTKIFSKDERKTSEVIYGTDILKELSGIIKVESDCLNYPMEILMTDQSREEFLRGIDFGICNVGLKIVKLGDNKKIDLIGFDEIRDNFNCSFAFFEDVKNKTITYNTHNKSPEQIEFSLTNHLKRITEKYPEHDFQLSDNDISKETKKTIETVMLMGKLNDTLNVQENPVEIKRKNKI